MSDDDTNYEVGYGKPPKSGQFKKGQSGNPKGRPKGAKGFNASLKREMEAQITIQEHGQELSISKGSAAAKRLVNKALQGDITALKMLASFDNAMELAAVERGSAVSSIEPTKLDHDILRDYYAGVTTETEEGPDGSS